MRLVVTQCEVRMVRQEAFCNTCMNGKYYEDEPEVNIVPLAKHLSPGRGKHRKHRCSVCGDIKFLDGTFPRIIHEEVPETEKILDIEVDVA